MADYRITKELILDVAEHCDLQTLSNLMQTNKEIHSLIREHERSICTAKLKNHKNPPYGLVLSSKDEQRSVVPERYSFTTIQELDLRERRRRSLLDNAGFLLTRDPGALKLNQESLDKFKAGLERAFYLTDFLADLATDPILNHSVHDPMQSIARESNATLHTRMRRNFELREMQCSIIRCLTTRDLAWLLTLCDGANVGYRRYNSTLLRLDPMSPIKVMAFKELLLRNGPFTLWAYVRGPGSMHRFITVCVQQTALEIMLFENSAADVPVGLHMTLVAELTARLVAMKQAEAAEKKEEFEEDRFATEGGVWTEVAKMIGEEIGCESWNSYHAVEYPVVPASG